MQVVKIESVSQMIDHLTETQTTKAMGLTKSEFYLKKKKKSEKNPKGSKSKSHKTIRNKEQTEEPKTEQNPTTEEEHSVRGSNRQTNKDRPEAHTGSLNTLRAGDETRVDTGFKSRIIQW